MSSHTAVHCDRSCHPASGAPTALASAALQATGLAFGAAMVWAARYATMRHGMSLTHRVLHGGRRT